MLYAKDSLNYWLRIQGYLRARLLVELLRKSLGARLRCPWEAHVHNLDEMGWRYLSWEEWPHHCTDGPECMIARSYTGTEVRRLMTAAGFRVLQMRKAHFPVGLAPGVERTLASAIGFYRFVWAVKNPGECP